MIYEMVNNCLESLANQWRSLGESFRRVADGLGTGALGDAVASLRWLCDNDPDDLEGGNAALPQGERQRIESEIESIRIFRRANQLFPYAIRLLEESEEQRTLADIRFNQLLGLPDTPDVALCREQLTQLREAVQRCLQEFEEVTTIQGERANIRGIQGSVENIAAYPVLTSGLDIAPVPSSSAPPSASGPSLQRTIETAMRNVLGRLPKPNDPRSFLAALDQSFELYAVEGRVEYKWTPRSYAGQTELGGGVTGAQASLYTRAEVVLENSLPLLDGLYALLPDADEELVAAARALVRSDLLEVVHELGVEGGPRVPRVDSLFTALLDQELTETISGDNRVIQGGHIGYLEATFGLTRAQVNTLEEETNVTNFQTLQDYVESLRQGWGNFRGTWFGRDLGTRLVLLSRALSVATEAVDEVYAAMDSVFVGPAERQVASFRDADGTSILIEDLLSWVVSFTSEEAPRLVHEGGRRGVEAIVAPTGRIEGLVRRLIQSIPHDPFLPEGLRHPRVRHPLEELSSYLRRVQHLAQDVYRP